MRKNVKIFLEHILAAINLIEEYINDKKNRFTKIEKTDYFYKK